MRRHAGLALVAAGGQPAARLPRRGIEQFSDGAGRIMSILRLPLIALVAVIGLLVPRSESDHAAFLSIWLIFAGWSVAVLWWMYHRPVPSWSGWLTTFVDLAAFICLAATSSGTTSYIGPVFYLYPIAVAFQYRPRLTAAVGFLIAGAYVISWLPRLGKYGGPAVPLVVWLYSGLLLWLASACTVLTVFLVRRSEYVLDLLEIQRQLAVEVMAMSEREHARIAEDLHDGPLQDLIAVRRNLEELAEQYPGCRLISQSDSLVANANRALRGAVTNLHPQVLAELGLSEALRELIAHHSQRSRPQVHAIVADIGPTPSQDLLYGTARELLVNVVQHAQAQNVWITLSSTANGIGLDVADDGTGLDPAAAAARIAEGHIGLASRSIRIADLGGTLTIDRRQPTGTLVRIWMPIGTPSNQ